MKSITGFYLSLGAGIIALLQGAITQFSEEIFKIDFLKPYSFIKIDEKFIMIYLAIGLILLFSALLMKTKKAGIGAKIALIAGIAAALMNNFVLAVLAIFSAAVAEEDLSE